MKKLLAIIGVSLFMLSACDKAPAPATTKPADSAATTSTVATPSAEEKTAKFVDYFVEYGCAIAKYDGDVPEAEDAVINSKYGFSSEADIGKVMNAERANKTSIAEKAAVKIEAKCKEDFTKAGVDPKSFVEATFDEY